MKGFLGQSGLSLALCALALGAQANMSVRAAAQTEEMPPADKYAWLEDVYGDKPLAWVKEHNARTAAVLEKDPHFAPLQDEALKVLESPDRLPWPDFHGGCDLQLLAGCAACARHPAAHHRE